MKTNLLKTICIATCNLALLTLNSFAQSPNWLLVKSAGGTSDDIDRSIFTDANGNVYMTGEFYSPSITFGTITLTNVNAGYSDIFIVKYNANGNILWAKSVGGTSDDGASSVSVDTSGNCYVSGFFLSSTITFGSTALNNVNIGYRDIFLVKYDANGNVLWAKSAGGSSDDGAYSVSADASGNSYLAGSFASSTISFGSTTLNNAGLYDIFLVKYDAIGNVLWAESAGGTSDDYGNSISTDANNNVYMTGYFQSPFITFGSTTLTNAGILPDIFIVKYDTSGNVLWAKSAGGTSYDVGTSVSSDANGNVFIAGYFRSSSIAFATTILTNAGIGNIFIVKYDASGNVLWAKSEGGTSFDVGSSISTNANGNVYMTGYFQSPSITFGSTALANTSASSSDIFIVKYDASGNVLWAKSEGGTSYDRGTNVSTDANGNVYMSGYFRSSSITIGSTTLTNSDNTGNTNDIFIAKLGMESGIESFADNDDVTIYPNPASGKINLKLSQSENTQIKIYNVFGECVHQYANTASNFQIDLSSSPSGVYFMELKTENGTATKKMIINQ